MQSTPPRYNQQMVAAEVRTSAQQAVRYVTGGVVVSPSTLEPPDITIPYKISAGRPNLGVLVLGGTDANFLKWKAIHISKFSLAFFESSTIYFCLHCPGCR